MHEDKKRDLMNRDNESSQKAKWNGENTFTLRAQDASAPTVIGEWIKQNIETAPEEKLHQALDIAIAMRERIARKAAD